MEVFGGSIQLSAPYWSDQKPSRWLRGEVVKSMVWSWTAWVWIFPFMFACWVTFLSFICFICKRVIISLPHRIVTKVKVIFTGTYVISSTDQIPMGAIITIRLDLQRSDDKNDGGDRFFFVLSTEVHPWWSSCPTRGLPHSESQGQTRLVQTAYTVRKGWRNSLDKRS